MTWVSGGRWIAGMLLSAGVANATEWRVADDRQPAVRVRVYDYAGVSAAVLKATKMKASELLGRTGVWLQFVDCRALPEDPPKDEACKDPATPLDLQMNILDLAMARKTGASRNCLGFALLSPRFPSRASVFYARALELAETRRAPLAGILGAMVAHEIGHLLLKQAAHSAAGIMRAQWGDQELKSIARGRLEFTADQPSQLLLMVAKRQPASHEKQWTLARSSLQ